MRTFRTFRQVHQPQIYVELFDEIVAAMRGDCLKKGDEWHTAEPSRKKCNASSCPEHGIPDFISFMPALRARNPVF